MPPSSQIKIFGKIYNVKYKADPKELQTVAAYVDSKMQELSNNASVKSSTLDLAILTALNIAQEYLELKRETRANHEMLEERTERLVRRMTEALKANEAKVRSSDNS
ncbi:MAG: cell division protein ZapA [Nitrospinae bacterium]|nr:cell division protein ZapA [Nitrospinota bacterium]